MPESLPHKEEEDEDDDSENDSSSPGSPSLRRRSGSRSRPQSQRSGGSAASAGGGSRPGSVQYNSNNLQQRPTSQTGGAGGQNRSRSLTRAATTNKLTALQRSNVVSFFLVTNFSFPFVRWFCYLPFYSLGEFKNKMLLDSEYNEFRIRYRLYDVNNFNNPFRLHFLILFFGIANIDNA